MMKRRTVKALVCATLMAISLSATACGGSDDAAGSADAATEEAAPAEEEAPAAEEAPAEEETPAAEEETPAEEEAPAEDEAPAEEDSAAETGSGETLEDYMNAMPDAKKQLEDQMAAASVEQEGVSIAVDVKGNDMIFIYTYEDASLVTDDTKETLETGLEAMASVFEMMAEQLDESMGEKGVVSIVVRYQDGDGNILTEKSFRAQ